jgi:long-chain fatty acid transport protein
MGKFISLFLKIGTLIIFVSFNSFAGGLEVSRQNNMILFSEGKTVNFSTRQTSSTVTDNLYTSLDSQSIIKKLNLMSAAFKSDYNENISYAFEMYEPMASTLQYPATIGGVPAGQKALLRSQALSLTGKYNLSNSGFGLVAGVRQLTIKRSTLNINPAQGDLVTTPDSGIGYVAGVSYEMPEIALKVLLTQAPGIDIVVPTTVVGSGTVSQPSFTTLEFETGIANNTLMFGSIHQGEHASAQVKLNGIGAISSFTDGEKYNIGVGRKFSEKLSGSFSYTTEEGSSATGTSLLSPTNGTDTYSIGVNYVTESVDVAFGYAMSSFGDKAVTSAYGTGNFTNNDATTTGLRIKFKLP